MAQVCKNMAVTEEKLIDLGMEALAKCGCSRCNFASVQLENEQLKKQVSDFQAQQEIEDKSNELADQLENEFKQTEENHVEQLAAKVQQKLLARGIDLEAHPFRRTVMQKATFVPNVRKNVYMNTQYGRQIMSPEMTKFIHYMKTGQIIDYKALSEGSNSAGGYTVPTEFQSEVIRKMNELVALRRAGARVITTSRDTLDIPVEDTRGAGGWVAEGSAYTESDPSFGTLQLTPWKYARIVKSSYELLEDSAINVAEYLRDIFADDFAKAEDKAFFEGTGSNQPKGILKFTNSGEISVIDAASTTTGEGDGTADFKADDLIDFFYQLAYRYHSNSVWIMNPTSVGAIRQMADSNGRYLWDLVRSGINEGEPARLLDRPVYITDQISDDATNGNQIILCDPSRYIIAQRHAMRVMRSDDYAFNTGQVAFRAEMRVDGKPALYEAFKILKNAPA